MSLLASPCGLELGARATSEASGLELGARAISEASGLKLGARAISEASRLKLDRHSPKNERLFILQRYLSPYQEFQRWKHHPDVASKQAAT